MDYSQVVNILKNDSLDEELLDNSKCQLIEELISEDNWKHTEKILLDILQDENYRIEDWIVIGEVFWGAVLDGRPITLKNKIIALLYCRLPYDEESKESNLGYMMSSSSLSLLTFINFF
ncbi:hypothetical protein [Fontibacillus sp. BL9]|uniref:hypothetical protein n=1 Tax=Fontibacillus sp. BL9 TaxID=3389971 RepID=UPI00397DD94A